MGSRSRIIQVYHPYWKWECYLNGMYETTVKTDHKAALLKSIEFTGNHMIYGEAMIEVVDKWPITMDHHLTNPNIGRKSFIGHCACCYKIGLPEFMICLAWKELTQEQRRLANNQADAAYRYWKNKHTKQSKKVHSNMGKQMLLQWNT